MNDIVQNLVQAYRKEISAYEEILELAHTGVNIVRQGRPLEELNETNRRKKETLRRVEQLEYSIAEHKQRWRSQKHAVGSRELDEKLGRLRQLIEEILECERETDRWILEGANT